jgi:hypothetical protein
MRQYVIDELSREERANIESYLKRTLKTGPMEGLYWIELPPDLLSGDQLGHDDCGPFFFAVDLGEESACFELLIRSQSNLHCSCIAHASKAQRDFVLRFVDKMLEEEKIRA